MQKEVNQKFFFIHYAKKKKKKKILWFFDEFFDQFPIRLDFRKLKYKIIYALLFLL